MKSYLAIITESDKWIVFDTVGIVTQWASTGWEEQGQ